MASVNKVILVGNLGQEPESRTLPSGQVVVNFSIATNESWVDKQSKQKTSKTEWHRLVAYGTLAEVVVQYAKKGSCLYVEGSLQTNKWQSSNGELQSKTLIVARSIQFLSRQHKDELVTSDESVCDTNTLNLDDVPF
jgi:single-strand DNA-binding protein